jgi:hypothetical protein
LSPISGIDIIDLDLPPSWHWKAALGALLACTAAFLLALKLLHLA